MPWGQHRRQTRIWALLALLLAVCGCVEAQGAPASPFDLFRAEGVQVQTVVRSVQEFLQALQRSAGSTVSEVITLTDDVYIRPTDLAPFAAALPFNGGNRTLVLLGGKPGANQTVLDFGGAVDLMYHPVGHRFFTYGLSLQGLAPASAGIAAGMTTQMVGGAFWPTTTGEPGHLMAFWNSTIRLVSPYCGFNLTNFTVSALHEVLGRTDTVWLLDNRTFYVSGPVNGSYAVRVIPTGDAVGNIHWSWYNTTRTCSKPAVAPSPVPPSPPGQLAPTLANHTAATGVASTPDELLSLLADPNVTRVLLGSHIDLQSASWPAYSLPLVLRSRGLIVESNDESPKVLDLGSQPQLLYLSADSFLSFNRVLLQGTAPPSSVMDSRSTMVVGSPLWPTVDGDAGHQLLLINCTVQAYVTPCSHNSTQITKDLLKKGDAQVQDVGDTGYRIATRYTQAAPIQSILTKEQVGSALYTLEGTVLQCKEDSRVALASELAQRPLVPGPVAPAETSSSTTALPKWVPGVIAAAAAFGAAVLAAGFLVWRRRRRRRAARHLPVEQRTAGSAGTAGSCAGSDADVAQPLTPRGAKMDRMESGELKDLKDGLSPAQLQLGSLGPDLGENSICSRSTGSSASSGGGTTGTAMTAAQELSAAGRRGRDALWRTRFGVIDGLEIGEMLGRGAYGKVYKGRWNSAIVAVKVVEHRASAGDPHSVSREPLLCMSVSHPNCITTYKLTVIRLLRGEDLLEPERGDSVPGSTRLSRESDGTEDSAMVVDGRRRRVLRSLLSGAEAVEVEDPYGALQPGLYETWIVSEFCERGALSDALAEKRLMLPDGRPHMAAIYLCLLDIASGMQYLHTLGIMHSDLKPANVLLKGSRTALRGFTCKLGDFGLSRMLDGRATHVETGSCGTATHAAPELLREGRLSPAVDVYAFAVLAWELVAGEEAFRGWHPMQIVLQVTQHGVRPPAVPHCPPALAALMDRCWREDPADRPSFSEILSELQQLMQELRKQQPTPPPLARTSSSASPSVRRGSAAAQDATVEPAAAVPGAEAAETPAGGVPIEPRLQAAEPAGPMMAAAGVS